MTTTPKDGDKTTCPECGGTAHYWNDDEDPSKGKDFGPRFLTCDDYQGCGYDEVIW